LYVGVATVGIFVYWFVWDTDSPDGHSLVGIHELMTWGQCSDWKDFKPKPFLDMSFESDPCSYFTAGKVKASALSLTVLVVIEMLNAFTALSEFGSLVQMPPWRNPWLILAVCGSIVVHLAILYHPFHQRIFSVCALDAHDWKLVMCFSLPLVLIDEVLKLVARICFARKLRHAKMD